MSLLAGNSNIKTTLMLIVSMLGSGLTFMPSVTRNLGIPWAVAGIIAFGLYTFYSLLSLVSASLAAKEHPKEKLSYSELAARLSKGLSMVVSISLVVSSGSAGFSFVISFAKTFVEMLSNISYFAEIFDSDKNPVGSMVAKATIVALVCMLYYFIFQLEDLSSLSFLSKFSLFSVIAFAITVCLYGIVPPSLSQDELYPPPGTSAVKYEIFDSVSMFIFSLHCQFSSLDIYDAMRDTSFSNARKVLGLTSAIAVLLYGTVGLLGFWGLGDAVAKSPINGTVGTKSALEHFVVEDSPVIKSLMARYGTVFGSYLPRAIGYGYGLVYFGAGIFNMFGILPILRRWMTQMSPSGKPVPRKLVAFVAATLLFIPAYFMYEMDLSKMFAFIGFFLTTPLSFLFPAIFVIYTNKEMNLSKIGAILSAVVSLGLMGVLGLGTLAPEAFTSMTGIKV